MNAFLILSSYFSLADIAQFQRVLEHPIYQEDPEGIVTEHVQQWVLKDAEGMEV